MLRAHLDGGQAHVWLISWDDAEGGRLVEARYPLLDEQERSRCNRFRFPEDTRQYIAAHALLRVALSSYVNVPPEDWRFRSGAGGKPRIARPAGAGLEFSLAHTDGLAACIVAEGAEINDPD